MKRRTTNKVSREVRRKNLLEMAKLLMITAMLLLVATAASAQVSDQPPDHTHYVRASIPEDYAHPAQVPAGYFLDDVVVANTDKNLQDTDTFNDTEPSIAVNPTAACVADPTQCEIIITTFSGRWYEEATTDNAPLWHSTDGGKTWTKEFKITPPPSDAGVIGPNCPCDQTMDYDRDSLLSGSFLTTNPKDIYSAATTDPTDADKWHWDVDEDGNAQTTNLHGSDVDQPWLLTGPGLDTGYLYVAYDFFDKYPWPMRVAVSYSSDPPDFKTFDRDSRSGKDKGQLANPGHRLATDPRVPAGAGIVYSLYQIDDGYSDPDPATAVSPAALSVRYMLNATTNYGQTWSLTGDLTVAGGTCTVDKTKDHTKGCVIARAESRQGLVQNFKFGGVNMLLGGVDAVAVDPADGDVYVVYGKRVMDADGKTRDHLMIGLFRLAGGQLIRINNDADLTPGVQAALPAIAVAQNHTIGVLYDTYNGIVKDYPQFTTHLAQSTNFGQSFTDQPLVTFLSPCKDDMQGELTRQRVLGDYQQLKAVGNNFFGAFTANGTAFDRELSNGDPVFVRAAAITP